MTFLGFIINSKTIQLSLPSEKVKRTLTLCHQILAEEAVSYMGNSPATRLTKQLKQYISWRPDPEAINSDALNMHWSALKAFVFLSVQSGFSSSGKGAFRPDRDCSGCSSMASTDMVVTSAKPVDTGTSASSEQKAPPAEACHPKTNPSSVSTPTSSRVSCLLYEAEGFSKEVASLLVATTRSSTS